MIELKKEYRVKKSSEIENIIKHKKRTGNQFFVIYSKENHGQNHFRFAVSVPKKFGNAVKRNKIKRQVREVISKLAIEPKYDVFIVIKDQSNKLSFTDIKYHLETLVKKHSILEVKK